MAPADLLLAIGIAFVFVSVGMNVLTAARFSGGKTQSRKRRVRSAAITATNAIAGLPCLFASFALS